MAIKKPRPASPKLSPDEAERLGESVLSTIMEQEDADALQSYLKAGRRFQHLDVDSLKARWCEGVRAIASSCSDPTTWAIISTRDWSWAFDRLIRP
jgi:hypothetical protein